MTTKKKPKITDFMADDQADPTPEQGAAFVAAYQAWEAEMIKANEQAMAGVDPSHVSPVRIRPVPFQGPNGPERWWDESDYMDD